MTTEILATRQELATVLQIPLSQLVRSDANVRKIKSGISIDELAEDIARRGLLQSISVRPVLDPAGRETGSYAVSAGGRRFAALCKLVEEGRFKRGDFVSERVVEEYLSPVKAQGVDTLVLGCTHYPLLTGVIQWVMGDDVVLVSSAEETAKDVYKTLAAHDLLRDNGEPNHRFLATGEPASFATMGRRFLGPEVRHVQSAVEVVS